MHARITEESVSSRMVGRFVWFLSIVVVVLATSGCSKSAAGPAFARPQVPPGKGVVHIYRPSAFSGGGRTIYLSVPFEANNCFALDGGGFFTYVTDAGPVNVGASGSGETKRLALDVAAGQQKYIRAEWGTWGNAELTEVSAAQGAREIRETRGVFACEK
jgi:hypothetical protein